MIGFLPVVHYHYDSVEPLTENGQPAEASESEPVQVYETYDEAAEIAKKANGMNQTGGVWHLDVTELALVAVMDHMREEDEAAV